MPKRFTLAEAQSLVPRLSELMREASAVKREYQKAESAIRGYTERIMLMGGLNVDRDGALRRKARLERATGRLRAAIEEIESLGCVVKDLEAGLVDFPTLFRGAEVYLCWKMGERSIRFWHGVDEGFAGRKKIDKFFRENHRGDPSPNPQ